MSDIIERAAAYAKEKHKLQVRRWTKAPYFTHLEAVADHVRAVSEDPEQIAAAYLHDVIEDTPTTYRDVEVEFGINVARMVMAVTNPSRHDMGSRALRVAVDQQYLAGAPGKAQTIKLADTIHNISDVTDHDLRYAEMYIGEKQALLGCLTRGSQTLWNLAWITIKQQHNRLLELKAKPNA